MFVVVFFPKPARRFVRAASFFGVMDTDGTFDVGAAAAGPASAALVVVVVVVFVMEGNLSFYSRRRRMRRRRRALLSVPLLKIGS